MANPEENWKLTNRGAGLHGLELYQHRLKEEQVPGGSQQSSVEHGDTTGKRSQQHFLTALGDCEQLCKDLNAFGTWAIAGEMNFNLDKNAHWDK